MTFQNTRVWLAAALLFFLFIAGVSIAADFRLIQTQVRGIPYFDKLGHFVLFGILAFLLFQFLLPFFLLVIRPFLHKISRW